MTLKEVIDLGYKEVIAKSYGYQETGLFGHYEPFGNTAREIKFDIHTELKKLTLTERLDLKSAAMALDVEKTLNIIDIIKVQHPELADRLRIFVDNYDFARLRSYIEE